MNSKPFNRGRTHFRLDPQRRNNSGTRNGRGHVKNNYRGGSHRQPIHWDEHPPSYDRNGGHESRGGRVNYTEKKPVNNHVNNIEIVTQKVPVSLPSVYKFSWKVFFENSFIDKIGINDSGKDNKLPSQTDLHLLQQWINEYSDSNEEVEVKHELFIPNNDLFIGPKNSIAIDDSVGGSFQEMEHRLREIFLAICSEQKESCPNDMEFKRKQHKLMVLALVGHAAEITTVYKEMGKTLSVWMFRRIYLVGDSRLQKAYQQSAWKDLDDNRPFLIGRNDLSLFQLMEFLEKNISPKSKEVTKGRILVVCSVGIRDVIRIIDERGVLASVELIIADMKRIRQEFKQLYGHQNELLYTDVLPADISRLLQDHRDNVHITDEQETMVQAKATTLNLIKFSYLLSRNMIVEDLSRFKHLPAWNLFSCSVNVSDDSSDVSIPSLTNGVNPGDEEYPLIASRICKLFKTYNTLEDPPKYNTNKRDLYFVCNDKFLAMEKFWPKAKEDEKPHFIFLPCVESASIVPHLGRHFPLPGNSTLVIWFDITEINIPFAVKDCEGQGHDFDMLKVDMPSFQTPGKHFDTLTAVRKQLESKAATNNIMFASLIPVNFKTSITESLMAHSEFNHILQPPPENLMSALNEYHLTVVEKLNLYLVQSNRLRGLPSWDLCSDLCARDRNGKLAFNSASSLHDLEPIKPATVGKIMMNISKFGLKTVESVNWMSFLYKRGPYTYHDFEGIKRKREERKDRIKNEYDNKKRRFDIQSEYLAKVMAISLYSNEPADDVRPNDELSQYFHSQSLLQGQNFQHSYVHPLEGFQISVPGDQNEPNAGYNTRPPLQQHPLLPKLGFMPPPPPPCISDSITDVTIDSPPSASLSSSTEEYVPQHPHDFYKPQINVSSQALEPSTTESATGTSKETKTNDSKLLPQSRKKISFGIKSKEEEKLEMACVLNNNIKAVEESEASHAPSPEMLEKIVTSLREAHEREVEMLRKHPESHSRYAQQHAEFVTQALDNCQEAMEQPNMNSIERVWEVFWRSQLEKSFEKTWEKRVSHLVNMISPDKDMSLATRALFTRLTKLGPSAEYNEETNKFSVSERDLLNKFKKQKSGKNVLSKAAMERSSAVILGERMLGQVQKGWKTIGCKRSQSMLQNAISKIEEIIYKPNIVGPERTQFLNLREKLNLFKDFLCTKEANPFDMDYATLATITTSFSTSDMSEYVRGEVENKGIENPAAEDIAVICKAINQKQMTSIISCSFVKGDVINPY